VAAQKIRLVNQIVDNIKRDSLRHSHIFNNQGTDLYSV